MISATEVESLRRQIKKLNALLRVERRSKAAVVRNNDAKSSRVLKLRKTVMMLEEEYANKASMYRLLQTELSTMYSASDAAKARIDELETALKKQRGLDNNIRLRLKKVLIKYHPDHNGSKSVKTEDVTKDLLSVLHVDDQEGV